MKAMLFAMIIGLGIGATIDASVPFVLKNRSLQSIYLEIPGVMNPNLSPMSNSGVELEVGQRLYFFHNEKKYLLLEVTEELRDQSVVVNRLIHQRKKELGLN